MPTLSPSSTWKTDAAQGVNRTAVLGEGHTQIGDIDKPQEPFLLTGRTARTVGEMAPRRDRRGAVS